MTGGPEEHTVREAALILGTTEGAIRARIRRGTLRTVRRGRRVYVILDGTEPSGTVESHMRTSEVEALRDEVEWLRGEVQRKDAILLNMTEAMKALSSGASEEGLESPETASEPQSGTEGREEQQRAWWRFWR